MVVMLLQGGRLLLKSSLFRNSLRHVSYTTRLLRPPRLARFDKNPLNKLGSRFVHPVSSVTPVVPADESSLQSEVQKRVQKEAHKDDEGPLMEKFIPLTRQTLVSRLGQEEEMLTVDERNKLGQFAAALDAFISRRFYAQLERMKVLYDPLDPDKDTIQMHKLSFKDLLDKEFLFEQVLHTLLYKANYFQIPCDLVSKMLKEHDAWEGVKVTVDVNKYDTLEIWTRGRTIATLSWGSWLKQKLLSPFRTQRPMEEKYTRVFVSVRSKGEKKLHLKIFKDVPCTGLEYLLPDGKIHMSSFDKSFLASSVLLGATAVSLRYAGLLSNLKLDWTWIGLGVAGLIGARAWVGYKNKRNQYLVNLSRTIYFKMVSNNRGVITLLTDRAQDEEFKEALLAYIFLLSPPNRRGIPGVAYTDAKPQFDTPETLKFRIEAWLIEKYGFDNISFDIDNALEVLASTGLLVQHPNSTLSVACLREALEVIPEPLYQWETFGALRDSVSGEEEGTDREDSLKHHLGWQ